MIYGYCRISTKRQSIQRQIDNIKKAYPDAIIIQEVFTGTKVEGRKEWNKLYQNMLKNGGTIVFDEVSRMSRNAEEGYVLYEELYNHDVNLVFLKEPHINTETFKQNMNKQINVIVNSGNNATDTFINAIMTALNQYTLDLAKEQIKLAFNKAENEVKLLSQRTSDGLKVAKTNGKQIGLKQGTKLKIKKAEPIKELIRKHSNSFIGTLADAEVISLINNKTVKIDGKDIRLHVARNTYYKYKGELIKELSK